jgi:hypothetical protein
MRPRDVDFATRILTVKSRLVVELVPKFHPTGERFLVKQNPKDQEYRRMKLSAHLVAKLRAHMNGHGISANDLLPRAQDNAGSAAAGRRPGDTRLDAAEFVRSPLSSRHP